MANPRPSETSHRALIAFAETMRSGGIGLAAGRLGLTHGAVSRQIAALEARLGVPLFEGPRNRRRPTAEAEALFAEIAAPLAALDAAMGRRVGRDDRVTVSCVSTLAARWLIPRLADFTARHPKIGVEIRESYAPLDRSLEGCDLAIRMSLAGQASPVGLVAHPFMANAIGLVVTPRLAENADRTAPRLVSRSHPGAWTAWRTAVARPGPTTTQQSFDHQRTMIEATLAGLGACVTQRALVEAELKGGRLVAPWGFVPDAAAFTAYLRQGMETRPARLFLVWLKDQGANTSPNARF